jgi:lipoyl-dependent peroxiredoxin subunit D
MYTEAINNMFTDLGIDTTYESAGFKSLSAVDSRYAKDLKLNVSSVLGSSNFNRKETSLLALATAINEKKAVLVTAFEQLAKKEGATGEEIAETYACTSVMNANNILYRFRHYMHDSQFYNNQPAGLRMNVMMNPVLGKEFFEMMSLVVSALNGCERCVTSHEQSVKQHGASEARVFDGIRIGSVIKSLCAII